MKNNHVHMLHKTRIIQCAVKSEVLWLSVQIIEQKHTLISVFPNIYSSTFIPNKA